MSPGTQRFSALHHAVTLLVDGSVYPDQVTVTAWYGGLGAFTMTGDEAAELFQTEYDEEHQDPAYWAELDTALAD
jgi:hypothetical protein